MIQAHRLVRPVLSAAGLLAALALGACAETGAAPSVPAARTNDPLGAGTPGVVVLDAVRYRVLKAGPANGEHPKRSDDVVVKYEGRLTNGKVFDSSASDKTGVATFPLGRLIPGWTSTVQLMRPGDEWLIYIPAYMAYGDKGAGNVIPPNADLVFRIELVSFGPHKGP
jgi:peptidylprolyl isomerase/FKBP-type peptidyl-prolyl cis-trans isomerase FklB